MSLFAICTVVFLYLTFGIFTWQFWLLLSIESHNYGQKYDKIANIPLVVFLFFWPISVLLMLCLVYLNKNKM